MISRRFAASVLLVPIAVVSTGLTIGACSFFTKDNVRTALDAAQMACVLFVEADDVSIVGKACNIHQDWWPQVRELMSAKKQAAARKAAMAATTDAGVDAATDGAKKD